MEARHEIIPFDQNNPVRLYMHKLGDVTRHWHESLELLFVLAGEVSVLAGDIQTTLQQDDMLLINSNVIHELHSDDCVMIAVQVKLSKFDLPQDLLQTLYFNCNSTDSDKREKFRGIKQIIASMLQSNAGGVSLFHSRSLAYRLLSELVENFKVEKPAAEANTLKHLDRLNGILRYISEHYKEQLTLNQLADQCHLSAPYLSSFFERYMGINFSTYYTNLRLDHAVQDLLHTDIPVEQIAANNGFSDPRAFVRAFKKRYNEVPSAYRKNAAAPVPFSRDKLLSINYLDFKSENYLHLLSQYLPETDSHTVLSSSGEQNDKLTLEVVDCTASGKTLTHKWRSFVGVGRAKDLLQAEVQDMLRQLQRDIGFRFLRFHGIFSDDMLVCRRNKDGSLQLSFTLVDKMLDFILSIGLKPLIQFSFMPADIAANPEKTIFSSPFTVSPPKRMEDWNTLVAIFLSHVRSRYGAEEIRSWLYSVWNEPDTSIQMFGFEDSSQFYSLYQNTFQTVKTFDRELIFGSPSLYPTTGYELNWLRSFVAFAKENSCAPQFMDVHYYSDDFENFDSHKASFTTPSGFSADPEHFHKYISKVQGALKEIGMSHIPLYITEWNLCVSHRNLINDTCFKGCYVAKNFLENYDRTDALGYWSLTDLMEENQPPHESFHGGLGLFTQDGIKKTPYHAMVLMRQLGDTLLSSGDGWFITRRKNGSIAAILYNYQHFDPLFLQEGFGLTQTARDGVFPRRSTLELTLPLSGLPAGMYRIRETIVNQAHGSPFDRWVEMGAQELNPRDVQWLRDNSQPNLHIYQAAITQDNWQYQAQMAPHELRLVEISPC